MAKTIFNIAWHHAVATMISFATAVVFAEKAIAEPVDDVMGICTRLADNTRERLEEFEAAGWKLSTNLERAARAIADSNALIRLPSTNTEEDWTEQLALQFNLQEHLNWPFVLERGDSFVFLGDIAPTNYENFATCAFATSSTQRTADIGSEAEALGTLTYEKGVYRGRISRTTRYDEENGWITVILLAAVGPDAKLPRKVEASTRLTFVNGPLRD
jgi:hypothetical protein